MGHAYGTAAVLVILILVINTVANWLMLRFRATAG
jgi:ABC-type phosphate transport system permease subunit